MRPTTGRSTGSPPPRSSKPRSSARTRAAPSQASTARAGPCSSERVIASDPLGAQALITAAVRTPIGRAGGALADVRPDDLGAIPLRALLERGPIPPDRVDDVILGCANQ